MENQKFSHPVHKDSNDFVNSSLKDRGIEPDQEESSSNGVSHEGNIPDPEELESRGEGDHGFDSYEEEEDEDFIDDETDLNNAMYDNVEDGNGSEGEMHVQHQKYLDVDKDQTIGEGE